MHETRHILDFKITGLENIRVEKIAGEMERAISLIITRWGQ